MRAEDLKGVFDSLVKQSTMTTFLLHNVVCGIGFGLALLPGKTMEEKKDLWILLKSFSDTWFSF
jgi:hypothetical protein